jgi:hypothetical protein
LKGVLDRQMTMRLSQAAIELNQVHETAGDTVRDSRFYLGTWPKAIEDIEHWPALVSLVRPIIGDDIAFYYRRFLIKDSRFKQSVAAHQDFPYWHGNVEKVHLFVPVSPNTARNGCLRFYAGSHSYGLVGQGDIDASQFRGITEMYDDLYPGDVVIMDHRTWHYSTPAETDEPRYLLQLVYQPSSDGSYMQKPELISGNWLTDIRFPFDQALIYANVKKYVEENRTLRERVEVLEREIAQLSGCK